MLADIPAIAARLFGGHAFLELERASTSLALRSADQVRFRRLRICLPIDK
jgi:hypothetical protein